MNIISIYTLKALRKYYEKCSGANKPPKLECAHDTDKAAQTIFNALMSDKPCMFARFGANEILCSVSYSESVF